MKVLLNLLNQLLQAGGVTLNNHNSHILYSPWISALLCPTGSLNETWGLSSPCGGNMRRPDQWTLRAQVPSCDTAEIIGWLWRSRYVCRFRDCCAADGRLYDSDIEEISATTERKNEKGFDLQARLCLFSVLKDYLYLTNKVVFCTSSSCLMPYSALWQWWHHSFSFFSPAEWVRGSIGHKQFLFQSSSFRYFFSFLFRILGESECIIAWDQRGHSCETCPPASQTSLGTPVWSTEFNDWPEPGNEF